MSAAVPPAASVDPRALRERAAALKHDLGKYVAFQSVNLGDDDWEGPVGDLLVKVLQADLLRTRSGPDGDEAASEVWQRLTADLPRPWPAPELAEVEAALGPIARAEAALREDDREALAEVRGAVRDAQLRIRKALSALVRRLREA